jgi:hypothetical protein
MSSTQLLNEKIDAIKAHFAPLIGETISGYETAELLLLDGTWEPWPDLPIRLHTLETSSVGISWSKFDDLWLASDTSLPFSIEDSSIRWVKDSHEKMNTAIGSPIRSAMLGRGEMSIGGSAIEIWTRLVIQVGDGWLEVFNALDENGYDYHHREPQGEFIRCI